MAAIILRGDTTMTARSFFPARRRGIPGTARVLTVTRTNQVSRSPEAGWHLPWIYRFTLLVSIPGRPQYVTRCRAYAPDILAGATVSLTASPLWPRHVTIDLRTTPSASSSNVTADPALDP